MRDFRHRPLDLHAIAQTQLWKARRVDGVGRTKMTLRHASLRDVLGQLKRLLFHASLPL